MSDDTQNQPVDNSHKSGSLAAKAAAAPAEKTDSTKAATEAPEPSEGEDENTEGSAPSDGKDAPARAGKKPGVHQRIDELTREKHEARREAGQLRKELESLKTGTKPAEAKKDPNPPRPKLADFDFDPAAHEAALEKWASDKAIRDHENARKEEATKKERAEKQAAFVARIEAFEKANPGAWKEATTAPITYSEAMLEVIATSEKGPELGVYLAKNLDEANRIATLSPVAAAAALGRIEASLSAASSPPAQPESKPVTKAPAPVTTLSGAPSVRKSYDDMSMKEYDEARRKERAAKGLAP